MVFSGSYVTSQCMFGQFSNCKPGPNSRNGRICWEPSSAVFSIAIAIVIAIVIMIAITITMIVLAFVNASTSFGDTFKQPVSTDWSVWVIPWMFSNRHSSYDISIIPSTYTGSCYFRSYVRNLQNQRLQRLGSPQSGFRGSDASLRYLHSPLDKATSTQFQAPCGREIFHFSFCCGSANAWFSGLIMANMYIYICI